MSGATIRPPNPDGSTTCCRRCEDAELAGVPMVAAMMRRAFIVCPTCGNKRCPKATDHQLACTDSNDPGQPGSLYK